MVMVVVVVLLSLVLSFLPVDESPFSLLFESNPQPETATSGARLPQLPGRSRRFSLRPPASVATSLGSKVLNYAICFGLVVDQREGGAVWLATRFRDTATRARVSNPRQGAGSGYSRQARGTTYTGVPILLPLTHVLSPSMATVRIFDNSDWFIIFLFSYVFLFGKFFSSF